LIVVEIRSGYKSAQVEIIRARFIKLIALLPIFDDH